MAYNIMATPVSLETPVGYVSSEDVYISYREYYGNGTIYGRVELLTPEGEPVRGAGKTKLELINANVVLGDNVIGSIGGDLVGIPNEVVPEAPAAEETPVVTAEETPVVTAEETPVVAAEETPVVTAEETPVVAPPVNCPCDCEATNVNDRYTVSLSILGFNVTRDFTVKIDHVTRNIYLN